jgi:hypothetical protein
VGSDPRPSGPRGQLAGQSLIQFSPRLDGHVAMLVHKGHPTLEVGGIQEEWPPDHVDGHQTIHLLQTDLVKSVQDPLRLYKRLFMMKIDTHTHHILEIPLTKLSFLV